MAFEYNLIPWDTALFGKPVLEVVNSDEVHQTCFKDLESEWMDRHHPFMVFTKIPAKEIKRVHFFEKNGFEYIETQFNIIKKISGLYEIPFDLSCEQVKEADLPFVIEIARNSFNTDRYSVDPFIGKEKSGERYSNWLTNSFGNPNYLIYKCIAGNEIVGFHMIHIKDKIAFGLLGGIKSDCKGTGIGLYINLILNNILFNQGIKLLDTHISAINIDIFNIDIYMQYKIKDVKVVLRKIYQ